MLQAVAIGGAAAVLDTQRSEAEQPSKASSLGLCLNTSTIRDRGERLSIVDTIRIAQQAGYNGLEPWIRELRAYLDEGGSTRELKSRLADAGLTVESAIGFAPWIVDDPARRKQALDEMRRDMELVRDIGGTRIAAPPSGATDQENLDLHRAAERYRAVLDLGADVGVVPQLELWGFSKALSRLGEVAFVATESGHPDACLLLDVYHIHKGGSDFAGLKLINGRAMHVLHMNDYPEAPREELGDADRVFPGDGVAPIPRILQDMVAAGFRGSLSLELFNRDYWKKDALTVAKTGVAKMRAVVEQALA